MRVHEFYPIVHCYFKVEEGITNDNLNKFCDGRHYFLHTPKLLHEFGQQYQTSGAQYAMGHLHIFKSKLDASKDMDPVANFHTMTLTWDNNTSFVLTQFKPEFVYYMKCDIPFNDAIKVNNTIGIGTTIHKFFNKYQVRLHLPLVCSVTFTNI